MNTDIQTLPLVITSADCVLMPNGDQVCSKTLNAPTGACFLGAIVGVDSPTPFLDGAGSTITADLTLGGFGSIINAPPAPVVGPTLPSGLGSWPAASNGNLPNLYPIEGQPLTFSITTTGANINAVLPGASLTAKLRYVVL